MKHFYSVTVVAILAIYLCLLIRAITVNSPVMSEDALLASGVSHYKCSRFDLYRVNPPLVRLLAAYPVKDVLSGDKNAWWQYNTDPLKRSEFLVGANLVKNRHDYPDLISKARMWVAVPFGLLGAFTCFIGARALFGRIAGLVSLLLWCFNPCILGHGLTIMNDVPAAATGIATICLFWCWLRSEKFIDAFIAGLALGLAELTKFTLVIFYPLFIVLSFVYRIPEYKTMRFNDWFNQAKQMFVMFAVSLLVINMGYLFEDTGKPLGSFRFQTALFSGVNTLKDVPSGGSNRFKDSLLGYVPMPLPANYIQGIDTQRLDFEKGFPSYLRGQWSDHGWWYYYLYALLIKTPLGTLGLFLLAICCTFFIKECNASWRDEMVVILSGLVLLAFVSSQTGFSVHSRYVIPALPFFFIWISKVGRAMSWKRPMLSTIATMLLLWSVGSSLWVYPHSISYFNELAVVLPTPKDVEYPSPPETSKGLKGSIIRLLDAGSLNGPRHLLDSNIDWGQDIFYLERWCQANPNVTEIKVACWGSYPLEATKIPSKGMPPANDPQPGWHALSVNYLYDREKQYQYFLHFEPLARAGYSIYIYHLTQEDGDTMFQ